MYKLLDGKIISDKLLEEYKSIIKNYKDNNRTITLCDIYVGDDPASNVYIKNKQKKCLEVGINFELIKFDNTITENELISFIKNKNDDINTNAIFIELPLPNHINVNKVIDTIDYRKDVDGFNIKNVGSLVTNVDCHKPCTAYGIYELLKAYNIDVKGLNCVVLGRSNIVGKPIANILLNNDATVTICHTKTKDVKLYTKKADILIVATRTPIAIDDSYIKEGAIVIDVGIHSIVKDGKKVICGDVDFDKVKDHTSFITPVPGGVGAMTTTMLIKNCIDTLKYE